MKRITIFYILAICCSLHISAQGLNFSGLLDSTVSFNAGAGDYPNFSYGIEEYANIRMQARIRDSARFDGAFNFIAASGDYALAVNQTAEMADLMGITNSGIALTSFAGSENFIAAIELERIHFRLNFETFDLDGGLMRMPFGYGQVWKPSDFLNPPNPLKPDARPRAVLGAVLTWFPVDDLKLLGFGAAPRDPFSGGGGGLMGISMDQHWEKASLQGLYSFESPQGGSMQGIHRIGLSVKADLEIGLVMDALYAYNHEAKTGLDGLSFSAGVDYSFFGGDLIVLAEYLYNGARSSTAAGYGGGFSNEHYLYSGFTWRFNDFTNAGFALIACFDDVSFTPIISASHELFQGAIVSLSAQIPLDRDLFSGDGNRGELGPLPPDHLQPLLPINGQRIGSYFNCTVKLRLRF
ncbi:MAG: hypothetical protein FWG89_02245 [Treponema sp.]|nr:hypothetical protein [Treponema sp.]